MTEVLRDNNRRLSALSAAFGYLREATLKGTPPKTAYEGFLRRAIEYHLLTVDEIREATDSVFPTYIPPPQQYTYYDLSYDTGTSEFSVAGGAPFHLGRPKTRFLARLISQPEVPHSKVSLYVTIWGAASDADDGTLRTLVKEVRARTADTIIPPAKLPETESFSKRTFHRIHSVFDEGFMLKRVWDLDEIAQGKDRLWTPHFPRT